MAGVRRDQRLAAPLDADALAIVVRRHADLPAEQAVQAAFPVAELPGDIGDALVAVAAIVPARIFAQQRRGAAYKVAVGGGIAPAGAGLPKLDHRRIDLRPHLRHERRRSDHQPLIGQAGAQVAETSAAGLGQIDRRLLSRGDLEQRLNLLFGKESRVGAGVFLRMEDHPKQAARRIDAIGDPVPLPGGKEHGLAAGDDRQILVREIPARFSGTHEQDLGAVVLFPGVRRRDGAAKLVVAEERHLRDREVGSAKCRLLAEKP